MAWSDQQNWISSLLGPSGLAICVTLLVTITVPLLLHFVIYRSTAIASLPTFLVVGPSSSGKTTLLTLVLVP